jgi:hypothetical protein
MGNDSNASRSPLGTDMKAKSGMVQKYVDTLTTEYSSKDLLLGKM